MSAFAPAAADDRTRLIWRQLQSALTPPMQRLLQIGIELADAQQLPLYLVGGPVRDAYLQRPATDLDLVVEGDAWTLGDAFVLATGGKMDMHVAFRTAVINVMLDGERHAIDLITARREVYLAPAWLPQITPSHIIDDLQRRDFTINTLALRLSPAHVTLLDPFNGIDDIDTRLIRVLHDASFRDDPTRILRAARFAARLSMAIEPRTQARLDEALTEQMIARTTPQRILNELWLTLDEPQPERVLALLHDWGAFEQLCLRWSDDWSAQFSAARGVEWHDVALRELYIGLLIWPMSAEQRAAFTSRYNLSADVRKLIAELSTPDWPARFAALNQSQISALELEQLLEGFSSLTLRVLQQVTPPLAAANIARYLTTIRTLPALLSGHDLRAQGVSPGPIYRELLAKLRVAQLTGSLTTREAALEWLRERLA